MLEKQRANGQLVIVVVQSRKEWHNLTVPKSISSCSKCVGNGSVSIRIVLDVISEIVGSENLRQVWSVCVVIKKV